MKIGGGQKASKTKKERFQPITSDQGESKKSTIPLSSSGSSTSSSSRDSSPFDIPNLLPGFDFETFSRSSSPPVPIPNSPAMGLRRARMEARENMRKRERIRRRRRAKAATKLQAVQRGVRARNLAKRKKELLYPNRPLIPPGTYGSDEILDDTDMFDDHGHTSNKMGSTAWVAHKLRRTSSKGGKRRKTKRKPIKINPKMKGVFTRKAKKHKMSVQKYARYIIKKYKGKTKNKRQLKLLKQAVFAKTAKKWKKRKRKFSRKKRRK